MRKDHGTIRRMVGIGLLAENRFSTRRATMTHSGWNAHAPFALVEQSTRGDTAQA